MFHPSWDFPPGHPGRYSDNPQHPFNRQVASLSTAGADIVFAAGNCGAECPDFRCKGVTTDSITGANALAQVVTVAGVDTDGDRVGYSSQGPGIAGMAKEKPDLAAYTHFLGAEIDGPNRPDSGTSAAAPVAAGVLAALRTQTPPSAMAPAALAQAARDSADGAAAGWNADTGYGIIDPIGAADRLPP
jgi:subtilisin family serine protease